MEDFREEHRRNHVLHLGHNRRSQGRPVFPSLQRHPLADGQFQGHAGYICGRYDAARGALVPRQYSWGIAFSAPAMGTKLVMPGPKLDGASVYELLAGEKATWTAGVPTVWL